MLPFAIHQAWLISCILLFSQPAVDNQEGPEGVKWDWDLPVFLTGKWDLLCWEWDFCHWEWEREHQMGMGFNIFNAKKL